MINAISLHGKRSKEEYKKPPDIGFSDRSLEITRHGAEFCPLALLLLHDFVQLSSKKGSAPN